MTFNTETQLLRSNFEGNYEEFLCKKENEQPSMFGSKKVIESFNKKIIETHKQDYFCNKGHIFLDLSPEIFTSDYPQQFKDVSRSKCRVNVESVTTSKKITLDLKVKGMFPNKMYSHGCIKSQNKYLHGCAVLIDSELFTLDELKEKGLLEMGPFQFVQFPFTDIKVEEYDYLNKLKIISDRKIGERGALIKEINESEKYKYGIFKVTEEWDFICSYLSIHSFLTNSYYIIVQSFSETWLAENNFPLDVPIAVGTNNLGKGMDGSHFFHYQNGLLNESISKNPIIRLQYYLNQQVYQQEFNEGRSHIVNEGEELEEIKNTYNMLPIVKASAFPMFANQYLEYQKRETH